MRKRAGSPRYMDRIPDELIGKATLARPPLFKPREDEQASPACQNLMVLAHVLTLQQPFEMHQRPHARSASNFRGLAGNSFRRLHITLMQQRGLTLFDLRRQAGHADVRTTQKYIADDIGRRQEAVNGLPKIVPIRQKVG